MSRPEVQRNYPRNPPASTKDDLKGVKKLPISSGPLAIFFARYVSTNKKYCRHSPQDQYVLCHMRQAVNAKKDRAASQPDTLEGTAVLSPCRCTICINRPLSPRKEVHIRWGEGERTIRCGAGYRLLFSSRHAFLSFLLRCFLAHWFFARSLNRFDKSWRRNPHTTTVRPTDNLPCRRAEIARFLACLGGTDLLCCLCVN